MEIKELTNLDCIRENEVKRVNKIKSNFDLDVEFAALAEWHHSKGHVAQFDIHKRLSKLLEEVGELAAAINKGDSIAEIRAELGDCFSVLTSICEIYGLTVSECVRDVNDKLSKR